MKKLLLLLLISLNLSAAVTVYDTAQNTDDTTGLDTFSDKLVKTADIVQDSIAVNQGGKVVEVEPWFVPTIKVNCETVDDYVCPPLSTLKKDLGHRVRLEFIDLKGGKLRCSVLPPLEDSVLTLATETPVYSEVFTQGACVEKYSTASNIDESDSILTLKAKYQEALDSLKQQEFKYTVDYSMNGDDKFLDLADVLDSMVTFNGDIIDLEGSLLSRSFKVKAGYSTLPNDTVVAAFDHQLEIFKGLKEVWSGKSISDATFVKEVEGAARIRDLAKTVADSNYLMLIDFFTKANQLIISLAGTLALAFISWSVVMNWIFHLGTNKLSKNQDNENHAGRFLFGLVIFAVIFAGDVQKFDIEYEDENGVVRSQMEYEQTRIQTLVQMLFSFTNEASDKFAKLGISTYLNSLNGSTGLMTIDQITSLSSEKMILEKEQVKLAEIDLQMCVPNYNLHDLRSKLSVYRDKTLNQSAGSGDFDGSWIDNVKSVTNYVGISDYSKSSLDFNIYPFSEREAYAMMTARTSSDVQKLIKEGKNPNALDLKQLSPYNDSSVVTSNKFNQFTNSFSSPLLLSGCYNNKKNMIVNKQRIAEIGIQLGKLDDDELRDKKVEYLRAVNEIFFSGFAKYGYVSIVFLPAADILINSLGVVGDLEERIRAQEENIDGADSGWSAELLKGMSTKLTLLSFFGGHQIATMVHNIKEPLLDWIGGAFPPLKILKGGSWIKNKLTIENEKGESPVDVFDYMIAASIIENMLNTMVFIVLIAGSILAFTLLFVEKIFAFISVIFLIIHAFGKNQEEAVSASIGRIAAVAFKTIILVVCIILAIFSISLISSLENIFVNTFFNAMDSLENQSWNSIGVSDLNILSLISLFMKKYIFFGVTKVSFIITKLILAVAMIYKMPNFMYELIFQRVSSVSDEVMSTLQQANEGQNMKV